MSGKIRLALQNKVAQSVKCTSIPTAFSRLSLQFDKSSKSFSFHLPLIDKHHDVRETAQDILKVETDDLLKSVNFEECGNRGWISFDVSRDAYVKRILESNFERVTPPPCHDSGKNILIEFSSPNIAKPFHVGHLRSTIIGNYISNLNAFVGNKVQKINYLGDWGTQFGLVQMGVDLGNISEEALQKRPIETLYEAYVSANKLSEDDPAIAEKAREIFQRLEQGDTADLEKWETYRNYTIDELARTYERLGVTFDEYNWESMYSIKEIKRLVARMEELGILESDELSRKVVRANGRKVPIIKSNGGTLYITRDIAAAIDRFEKYHFDEMYYVVDALQASHFSDLMEILKSMKMPWVNRLRHVRFGKILGMSTRKGTVVFLKDLLDEMRVIMREKQMQSLNNKTPLDATDDSSDALAISAVIVNDLQQRRSRNYEFDWNKAFDITGTTGAKLQYTHCRLTSLEENCGATLSQECDPSLLKGSLVDDVVYNIGKFDDAILRSYSNLESSVLVHYLFDLCHSTNKAMELLRIKGEPSDIGSQRLLLFHAAKRVLAQGMKLLGLSPLNKM